MASKLAVSIRTLRTSRRPGRIARLTMMTGGLVGFLAAADYVEAQDASATRESRWEFLVSGGKVVPTGAQRVAIKGANLTAAQLSYSVHPALAVTATLGWARSRDIASEDDPRLDVFTYDLGAEVRSPRVRARDRVTVRGFAGAGAGMRSYNYRSLDVDATHNRAAYGSIGGEIGVGRVSFRLEARDYVTGFKPLAGGSGSDTRNDIAILAGLRIGTR